ncbi:tail protein with endopeptidase activity [Lactobacillus phage phiJL-1]|uniref:Tail spike domain-containing protein n=1 Tax=Lactobacillus phage phiJL-1 TaxID=2892345 RepID=Q597U4_9CAUD|nr:tail protein with endopeptidase activity [Lactobacillus phage phiJL-1]AAP74527.1 putative protein [Lactobacillus phage phiJL-1]
MTVFKDINNKEYVADTEIKLTEGVNGEKSLTGTIYFGNDVKKNLAKGWTMVFNDEEYAVVTFRYNDTDNTVSFSAVQMFFYTLSIKAFHEKWNGSHPLNEYLNAIFKDTGYSYNNETSTAAFEKENWGLKDKLTLFNDIINQISAEFEVQGTTVYIKDKIGSDLSTVVRQGFNLSTAEIETDNSSFATYGVGYGAHDNVDDQTSPRLSVEYYSPLYDMYKAKFGTIEAEPVDDERYTIADNLLAAVKAKVDNSWSLAITVSLLDLQNAGYPYAMASAGDSITIVDESLGFEDEVRIIKVVSSYNINGERISVDVTCGDLTMAQTQSASSSVATSTITDIINGNSVLPDAWFSEQMQLATNSILDARTELKFTDQGIIAIDKSDHNKMVILNSAGIGVSTDGGQTFKTAITAESIDGQNINIKNLNASNIVGGIINGITYNTVDDETNFRISLQKGMMEYYYNDDLLGGIYATGDVATGKVNGFAIWNHPGYIFSINQANDAGDQSKAVFQIPITSTMDDPKYNLYGYALSDIATKSSLYSAKDIYTDGNIIGQSDSAFWIKNSNQVIISGNGGKGNQLNVYGDHVDVLGDFTVYNGTKNAASVTRDGVRATPAYEMAENWFGDMGESTTDGNCEITVPVDPIFGDIVNTSVKYQVFLQSYSSAHVWVDERNEDGFVVKSDQPNAKFAWELKAKRRGYENNRLVKTDMTLSDVQKIEEGNGTMSNDEYKEYKGGNVDGN